MNQITKLATSSLHIHPENTKFFDDIEGEQYERFKKSIQEDGVLTPLMVAPDMTIISGHQRYKACKDLGINLVPVIIREDLVDEDEKLKKLLATNFGREKNDPVKQGRIITEYEKLCGIRRGGNQYTKRISQLDIAKEFGISTRTVRRIKSLLNLIPELQDMVEDNSLKPTTAINIFSQVNKEKQLKIFNELGKNKLSNMTAKEIKKYLNKRKPISKSIENHLIARSKGHCEICGYGDLDMISLLEKHHIKPISEGGNDELENLIMICPNCHKTIHILRNEKENNIKENILKHLNLHINSKIKLYI